MKMVFSGLAAIVIGAFVGNLARPATRDAAVDADQPDSRLPNTTAGFDFPFEYRGETVPRVRVRQPHAQLGGVPTVTIGAPNAQGDLDKAIIRRYIKRNIQKIQYCYEKAVLGNPELEGTLLVQFFITPSGTVAQASGTGVSGPVASCVAGVIKEIEFPKPKGGGGVQVNYPFDFRLN